MQTKSQLPFFTLLLLISFASVNAVLFTPALPDITQYFSISNNTGQLTITWFLVGYAFGQLIYGPIANRLGRKPALYIGIILQLISSFMCIYAGWIHEYFLLVTGRFLLALGSGVGLKITFTLVNECYEPKIAGIKISYLILAFAISPGLAVALGGLLSSHFGWESCFYAGAIYGVILLFLSMRLPETQTVLDYDAFKLNHLLHAYGVQFKNLTLITGALLMGGASSFVYVFAALAPFIAINIYGLSSVEYGLANILPATGMLLGSLIGAVLAKRYSFTLLIRAGIFISMLGAILILLGMLSNISVLYALFVPMMLVYFGLCFVLANASTVAMNGVNDKAHGSAVMSFINMGTATVMVLMLALFPTTKLLLPIVYLAICFVMLLLRIG